GDPELVKPPRDRIEARGDQQNAHHQAQQHEQRLPDGQIERFNKALQLAHRETHHQVHEDQQDRPGPDKRRDRVDAPPGPLGGGALLWCRWCFGHDSPNSASRVTPRWVSSSRRRSASSISRPSSVEAVPPPAVVMTMYVMPNSRCSGPCRMSTYWIRPYGTATW